MKLSAVPDLKTKGQLAIATLAVWLVVSSVLLIIRLPHLSHAFGDTDDALRISMVRDLLNGQGWYDQRLARLQPPMGVFMHWSRLIDGGEALTYRLFALLLPQDKAEIALRATWPLLWLAPTIGSILIVARRLGGGKATFLTALSLLLSFILFGQFNPGRVDHHNVQIACCLMAFAAAVQKPTRVSALICGLASALGLAVGLEALPLHAVIGATWALNWVFRRDMTRSVSTYGASIGLGALALWAIQTPPSRWFTPSCDALSDNLVAALLVVGLGLAAAAWLGDGLGRNGRLAVLAALATVGGAVYLSVFPICIHGPMAQIDPDLKRVWLWHVQEMTPWGVELRRDPVTALIRGAPALAGLLSWLWLGRRAGRRTETAWLLCGAVLLMAIGLALEAIRSTEYAVWLSAPLIGAAIADVSEALWLSRMIPAVAVLIAIDLVTPWICVAAGEGKQNAAPAAGPDPCFANLAFEPLQHLPTGLTLGEIDLGSFVLANTPDGAMDAPYHRMTWGIKQTRAVLGATPAAAQVLARRLNVTYVLNCPSHIDRFERDTYSAVGLQHALDHHQIPVWLEPLSKPSDPLQIFRIRPQTR